MEKIIEKVATPGENDDKIQDLNSKADSETEEGLLVNEDL